MADDPKQDPVAYVLDINRNPMTNWFNFMMLSNKHRFDVANILFGAPALFAMLFLRSKIGYRKISMFKVFLTCLFVIYMPFILDYFPKPRTTKPDFQTSLIVLAGIAYAIAYIGRWLRWRELQRGDFWHSHSEGISWFAKIQPFISQSICNRFIDPILCAVIGILIASFYSDYIGGWFVFCAISLYIVEITLHEARIDKLLDQIDGLCEAEASSKDLEALASRETEQGLKPKPLTREETAGVPTGVAPDIEAQINRRRTRKPPPDDLAPAEESAAA